MLAELSSQCRGRGSSSANVEWRFSGRLVMSTHATSDLSASFSAGTPAVYDFSANAEAVVIARQDDVSRQRYAWCLPFSTARADSQVVERHAALPFGRANTSAINLVALGGSVEGAEEPPRCSGSTDFAVLGIASGLIGLSGRSSARSAPQIPAPRALNETASMQSAVLHTARSVLTADDERMFEEGTGQSSSALWSALARHPNAEDILLAFSSVNKFLPHLGRFNEMGLQAMRSLVAERGLRRRRHAFLMEHGEAEDEAHVTRLERDGFLTFGPFNGGNETHRRHLLRLLRLASAEPGLSLPCARGCHLPHCCDSASWLHAHTLVHREGDDQYETHSDTYQVKVLPLLAESACWGCGTAAPL